MNKSKIDGDLLMAMEKLPDEQELNVLIYPKRMGATFESLLRTQKEKGVLDYNILELAGCAVVKAPKRIIVYLGEQEEVSRIASNARFTTD